MKKMNAYLISVFAKILINFSVMGPIIVIETFIPVNLTYVIFVDL